MILLFLLRDNMCLWFASFPPGNLLDPFISLLHRCNGVVYTAHVIWHQIRFCHVVWLAALAVLSQKQKFQSVYSSR